ncbi:MAG TPA: PfkB family carbohydrate kinase [Terriglobales bacterium]|nr:PfkB family carbohydrate kinase [Terriglobales bacterium]
MRQSRPDAETSTTEAQGHREMAGKSKPRRVKHSPAARPKSLREHLAAIVDVFPRLTVTVLADLVADEFVFGEIARVSREAPVLILKHRDRSVAPGGGANAIANLAELGVNVLPVGIVGDDEPGRMLLQRFRQKRIPLAGILKLRGYDTVTKTRILAGHPHTSRQQVVRVDREPESAPDGHALKELAISARKYAAASDAFLISDYGYGAASPDVWNAVRESLNGIPVTLDSRYRLMAYSGITAATPNEPEVEEALRVRINNHGERLAAAAKTILDRMRLESLVITRGRDGMVAFARRKPPVAIPIHGPEEAADVTGAGDTVIATFTAALAAGADAEAAARLANIAGGIVVMKRGTATVGRDELLRAIAASA